MILLRMSPNQKRTSILQSSRVTELNLLCGVIFRIYILIPKFSIYNKDIDKKIYTYSFIFKRM